jgi:hypothetical protein
MIACKGGKDVPCAMKLSHYLRYYERMHGTKLSPEMADKEAAKEGFVLDHGVRDLTTRRTENRKVVPHDPGQAWAMAESCCKLDEYHGHLVLPLLPFAKPSRALSTPGKLLSSQSGRPSNQRSGLLL